MRTIRPDLSAVSPLLVARRRAGRAATRVGHGAKRVLLETTGWLALVVGLVLLPLPGPGSLIIVAGLLLLSHQHAWARRRVEVVRRRALQAAAQSVATRSRLAVSVLGAVLLLPVGVVWILSPLEPRWWPLPETWWLPGGVVVGVSQLVSAVIALALLSYSYRRFGHTQAPFAPTGGTGEAVGQMGVMSSAVYAVAVAGPDRLSSPRRRVHC